MISILGKIFEKLPRSLPKTLAIVAAASISLAGVNTAAQAGNSKYSGIVMDAKTGKILYSYKAHKKRYPASLTKMMTMYLIFEALDSGRITRNTQVTFSKNAASEVPTKLYIPAGKSASVETIMYALATRSANDASTAIAEYLGGSESNFARLMTRKARQLGMKNTTFRNANGLTARGQMTTAYDMALLGIALREHYPQYYKIFKTRNYRYGKMNLRNHNRLLGRVRGVDGIKTGYTRASGYNLVTSAKLGKRSIVAVVMGGRSGKSRNAQMTRLINSYMRKATTRTGSMQIAAKTPVGFPGSRAGKVQLASAKVPDNPPRPSPSPIKKAAKSNNIDTIVTASTDKNPGGWQIQIAATSTKKEAKQLLNQAQKKAPGTLNTFKPYIEPVATSNTTLHRARFVGFSSKNQARKACNTLKRNSFDCIAIQG